MKISDKSRRHGQARVVTLAAVASFASSSFANVINLTSSKDNTLYEDPTGSLSNGAGDAMFVGKTAGNTPPLQQRPPTAAFCRWDDLNHGKNSNW